MTIVSFQKFKLEKLEVKLTNKLYRLRSELYKSLRVVVLLNDDSLGR